MQKGAKILNDAVYSFSLLYLMHFLLSLPLKKKFLLQTFNYSALQDQ